MLACSPHIPVLAFLLLKEIVRTNTNTTLWVTQHYLGLQRTIEMSNPVFNFRIEEKVADKYMPIEYINITTKIKTITRAETQFS